MAGVECGPGLARGWATVGAIFLGSVCLAACGGSPAPGSAELPGTAEPNRTVCGWDHIGAPGTPSAIAVAGETGPKATVTAGQQVVAIRVADEATMEDLLAALRPAASSLVRVKVAVGATALLALTIPQRPPPDESPERPTPPKPMESVIIGHRKVTRPRAAPRERIADLRVEGAEVTVFVENGNPGGQTLPIATLASHLRAEHPPAGVFTLGAAPATRWAQLRDVITAAACYDRAAGEEPHEVLLPLPDEG